MKSKVAKHQGKTPVWNENFTLATTSLHDEIEFVVKDKDHIKRDDLVASGFIKVSSLILNSGVSEWFSLEYKGKNAGMIYL
jgi:Ca2+-dependent lipid-binding protein